MPAIISDQFRILNAANFVAGVADTSQYYYSFIDINAEDLIDIDIDNSSIDKLKFIKLMIRYANLEKIVWNDLSMVDSDSLKFVV